MYVVTHISETMRHEDFLEPMKMFIKMTKSYQLSTHQYKILSKK